VSQNSNPHKEKTKRIKNYLTR